MPDLPASADASSRLRWLTPALLGGLAGTAWQLQQAQLWSIWIYLCFMAIALMGYALAATFSRVFFWQWQVSWLLLVGLSGLLTFGLTGARASIFATGRLDPALEGRDVAVIGVVVGLPQRFEQGIRFGFALESAQLAGQPVRLPAKLALAWYSGFYGHSDASGEAAGELQHPPAPLLAGDRWQFTVRLKAIHGTANPYGFDYELAQWEQDVQASGYVRAGPKDPPPQHLEATLRDLLDSARQHMRERIYLQIHDANAAGLVAALVVGDQSAIEPADWRVFRATGVAHLMSISGLHITMFAWLAGLVINWLWRRSAFLCLHWPAASAALVGGVLLAWLYALFSGMGVPAQRTVLMLATVALLRLSGQRWPWPQVWLLTCAMVVLLDPWALLQAGFWLSFVAVGILFAADPGATSADRTRAGGHFYAMFHEQWVITLALTPLSLVLFGQVSLVGLPANALAIPWVTLLVTPLAMLGTLLPLVWDVAAWAVQLMMLVLHWLAALPWAVWSAAQAPWWAAAAGVLGGVIVVLRLPLTLRLAGLPLLLPVLLWQAPQPPAGQFELLAADIGQGSAVLVRTSGHALLFDAGPRFSQDSDAGQRVLVPLLRALGVQLDALLLSHRDSDHIGGATAVLAMQSQASVISSFDVGHNPGPTDSAAVLAVAAARSESIASARCQAGQRWHWDGVDFELLHPLADDYHTVKKANPLSCVLHISNGQHSALLTGDIEQAQEVALVQRLAAPTLQTVVPGQATLPELPSARRVESPGLRSEVLLVPHHGSKSSSSAVFLDAVQPRIALVQAGYRNRFGHPAGPVLVRYADRHIKVVDTPHCGAATWQSWQPETVQCQRQLQPHYWQHRAS